MQKAKRERQRMVQAVKQLLLKIFILLFLCLENGFSILDEDKKPML
jgi:hypothetical protein